MSSTINKRSRSTNWSEEDKKLLRKLVLERAHILENKDTSTNTNTAKKLAWEDVLSCYNIISLHKRDMNQIQNQWRNMKNRAKASNFRKPELPRLTKPTHNLRAKLKKTGNSNSDYEHQLFLLAKKSREDLIKQQQELHLIRIEQERELHEKRLQILALEEEYLQKKIIKLER